MLTITNNGQEIVSTNYWDSGLARRGLCYLSWNAGAARLLLPDALRRDVREMQAAKYVIVSLGPWQEMGGREALEMLFEDGSDAPYCLHLSIEQSDRRIPEAEQGSSFVVAVWTRQGQQISLPGKYRRVSRIPCLEPWRDQ